ncbi:hypothetical protein PIB30_027155 [Stylosanthes scabra]|uniref:Uncharacterized protein n=1 Tax=Stylosanthes scabra TaxID=79078 RepID=A0ABU6Z8B3_9FABA|nr:hypothetical protein [Stylosanthes scabra]
MKTGHNSRGCDKKKEAMGRDNAGTSGAGVQGQDTNSEGRRPDLDEDAAREQEMFWEETLDDVVADAVDNEHQVRPPRPKKKTPKRNLKRPPPSQHSPLRPHQPQDAQPLTVTPHTMRGASLGTTSRFQDFMPTPRTEGGSARTWPMQHFKLPTTTTFH